MSYCPECQQNVQIVMQSSTTSEEVPTRTDRYFENENGLKVQVGWEEGHQQISRSSSTPRCSNCFAILIFPQATSAEAYEKFEKTDFERIKERKMGWCKNEIERYSIAYNKSTQFEVWNHKNSFWGIGCVGAFLALAGLIAACWSELNGLILLLAAALIIYARNKTHNTKKNIFIKSYEKEMAAKKSEINVRLSKLSNLTYSHGNYKMLCSREY